MSIKIMSAAWTVRLPHSDKIVLLALADNANDEGLCFPSITTLSEKCGLTDRALQLITARLEQAGHVGRELRPGKATVYRVHPRPPNEVPPERGSPQNQIHPRTTFAPNDIHQPPNDVRPSAPSSPSRALPLTPPLPSTVTNPERRAGARARSRTVPVGFEITEAMRKWAKEKTPNVDIEAQTERFRDHEFRDPHSDWAAAWRQWMRRTPEFQPRNGAARKADYVPPKTIEQLEAEERARDQH